MEFFDRCSFHPILQLSYFVSMRHNCLQSIVPDFLLLLFEVLLVAPPEIAHRLEVQLSLVRQKHLLCFDVVLAKHFEEGPVVLPVAMNESCDVRCRGFCDQSTFTKQSAGTESLRMMASETSLPNYQSSVPNTCQVNPNLLHLDAPSTWFDTAPVVIPFHQMVDLLLDRSWCPPL